jgi:hypothetical protein
MTPSDWIALAAVASASITAVASIYLTQRGNLRLQQDRHTHERQQRLTDRREALYIDLAEYTQDLEARLPAMTDEYGIASLPQDGEGLVNELRLDARVRVLAPDTVLQAWTEFRKAEEAMRWEGHENPDGYDPSGMPYLDWDGRVVTRVRTSLAVVQESLRTVMLGEAAKGTPPRAASSADGEVPSPSQRIAPPRDERGTDDRPVLSILAKDSAPHRDQEVNP